MSQTKIGVDRRVRLSNLLWPWVVREVRIHYRQSALDIGWSLLTPVLVVAGYGLVLTRFFGVDGDEIPYLTFAWSGVVLWSFVASAATTGAWSLVNAADLVRKVAFPHEAVPLAAAANACLELIVGLVILLVLATVQGVSFSITALSGVLVLAGLGVFATGSAILLAALTAFVRDAAHGVSVLLRVGIFVTPVMYPVSIIPSDQRWVVPINPVSVFIEAFRDGVLRQTWPDWRLLGVHSAGAFALLVGSLWYIRRVGGRLSDVI